MQDKWCRQCGKLFYADEDWKRICLPCWRENNGKTTHKRQTERKPEVRIIHESIPEDILKILIMLCHPDRHGGKDMAVKATQYLLRLRK